MPRTAQAQPGFSLSPAAVKLRLLKRLRCTLRYEKIAWSAGAIMVAGVDEVGRGSLFGPVVAAAVILDRGYRIRGLRDSKLLLPDRRELLAPRIREHAIAWAVAAVDAARIDQINIYQASRLAMREAVMRLQPEADHLLVDAVRLDCDNPAACHHSRRCAFRFDRRSFHPRQSRTRSHDVRVGCRLSRIRPRLAQGLQYSEAFSGFAELRSNSSSSSVLRSSLDESRGAGNL